MRFDEVLSLIGGFGRYQKIQFMLVCVPAAVIALHQLASVFLAATPDHRCAVQTFNGTDEYTKLPENINGSHPLLRYIPYEVDTQGKVSIDSCHVYTTPGDPNSTLSECTTFVYSKEYFTKTITTQWDLVCQNKFQSTLSTMLYMSGKLAGALIFGILSDILGRKKTMLLAILLQGTVGLATAFSPNYLTFVILRFVIGAVSTGLYMCLFVLGMELIGTQYRMYAGIFICYFFALGYVLLAGIAYLSMNWVYTEIAISAPAFLFLTYYWLVPESARWLISKNRTDEAKAIIVRAAKTNGRALPADFSVEVEKTETVGLKALFNAKYLCIKSIIIFINWFAVAMGYYGLSLNAGTLEGNVYLIFMMSGAVEFVAYSACLPINKIGRKVIHVAGMMIAGLASIGVIIVDLTVKDTDSDSGLRNNLFIALNIIGKFGMTVGFAVIYIWSAEVFPTEMRTSLMGISSMIGRVGQILAPFIADIGNYVPAEYSRVVQSSIFGVTVIVSGLLSIMLPETAGQDMPETVADANQSTSASTAVLISAHELKRTSSDIQLEDRC